MGEALFRLTATRRRPFTDTEQIEIHNLIGQLCQAYEFWQSNRENLERKPFWKEFCMSFPSVVPLIAELVGGDNNNALAGVLSYGDEDTLLAKSLRVKDAGHTIVYDQVVWHFANWDRLANYLSRTYDCTAKWEVLD